MGQQTGEGFRVGNRKHRRQADEHVAEIDERIVTVIVVVVTMNTVAVCVSDQPRAARSSRMAIRSVGG